MTKNLTPDQTAWIDRARDADILDVALRPPVGAKLKRAGREQVGPCPRCGGEDRFAVNRSKRKFICRGAGGGDVIAMVQHVCAVQFLAACEIINGEPMPSAGRQVSAAEIREAAEQREAGRAKRDAEREAEQEKYRETTRHSAFAIWQRGAPFEDSPAETYLRECRGIKDLPDRLKLRFAPDLPYFEGCTIDDRGFKVPRLVHRGPAMLAPIVEPLTGKFRAVHRTWIDLDQPNGKARVLDPQTGKLLDAKKGLGSKQTNVVRLVHISERPGRLYIGEGIETVLSVWYALHKRSGADLLGAAFWSASDLGNLAGKASGTVPHPADKAAAGRPTRVSGPVPDLTSRAIAVPDSVTDVILLGDGDSDRFITHCALARAAKRFALTGRTVRCAWAPDGMDFNDLLRAA
jgi:hypothetical protein